MADDFNSTTAVMGEFRHIVAEKVAESDGTLVNFVGDNFMAVFDDPKDVKKAAIGISGAIEARNADIPPGRQVKFRMGLDQGPVTVTGDQYFGDALNIAARIQAMAPAGGLSISGRVYRSLDEPALRFHSIGRKSLKNIPEEVEIFQFSDPPTDGHSICGSRGECELA